MATLSPEPPGSDNLITAILLQPSAGNREVEALLIPQIYGELRRLAARHMRMRQERGNHTLEPTALVREAHTQPIEKSQVPRQCRAQFVATASRLMHRILVDHEIKRLAAERGRPQRRARIVELHFFGGLNTEEIAELTIKRDWCVARTWLKGEPTQKPFPRK